MTEEKTATPVEPTVNTPSNEELIENGLMAKELLNNATFNNTIRRLIDGTVQAILSSKPEENKQRELGYSHYRALCDIVNTLQQQVGVMENIEQTD
jgi:hypothetical protein